MGATILAPRLVAMLPRTRIVAPTSGVLVECAANCEVVEPANNRRTHWVIAR